VLNSVDYCSIRAVLYCSLPVLDLRVRHTMDVLCKRSYAAAAADDDDDNDDDPGCKFFSGIALFVKFTEF